MTNRQTPLLDKINTPDQLRQLPASKLPALANDLRYDMIKAVSQTGGHLGAGLGVIELTIALHYIFDTPDDKLIWDVGHQAYPHKILTGRRKQMSGLRQEGGYQALPNAQNHSMTRLGLAIPQPLFQLVWAWPSPVICKVQQITLLPLSVMVQ